jgi:hypothetical protein
VQSVGQNAKEVVPFIRDQQWGDNTYDVSLTMETGTEGPKKIIKIVGPTESPKSVSTFVPSAKVSAVKARFLSILGDQIRQWDDI